MQKGLSLVAWQSCPCFSGESHQPPRPAEVCDSKRLAIPRRERHGAVADRILVSGEHEEGRLGIHEIMVCHDLTP